jgi:RNA polymerase sigma factor (sigma-70 family)
MSGSNASQDLADRRVAQWFATTHWSVVLNAADTSAPGADEALEKLCRTYWYPLYAHVRRQGRNAEDAQDLTQAFFEHFLGRKAVRLANRERGKFRSFLLTSLNHFLNHEWERAKTARRGGGQVHLPWDQSSAESQYEVESLSEVPPEKVYDRRWALALFQEALARLRQEHAAAGKVQLFEQLKEFLTESAGEGTYGDVATRLGMSSGAVAVAVHRLRQRYGELVREEIAHTVTNPAEVQEELHYLIELVGG